jgi:hypothetical protein
MQRGNREPAFPTSRKERSPWMRRSSLPRGAVVTPGPAEEPPEELLSDFFDIFRLAARAHGPLSNALEFLTALFAAVVLAFHPIIIELDIDRSTDCTHLASPGERWERKEYKTLSQ